MTIITTRITVTQDGAISTTAKLPPGEYLANLETRNAPIRQASPLPLDVDELPALDVGPWPEGLSLRREDIYGDDGR